MKSVKFLLIICSFLFVLALLTSCEEEVEFNAEETNTYNTDGNVEASFALVEAVTNAGMSYVEQNGMGRIADSGSELECAVLTYSGTKESGRLEIDFGDGCLAKDGRTWKGVVVLEYDGRRYEEGSVVYTVFQDFYIDEYKIEGTVKSTTLTSSLQQAKFDVTVTNGKLIWPDGSVAEWNADRTHTWSIANGGLMLSIEGTANGVNTLGTAYMSEITQPIIFKSECVPTSAYMPIQGEKNIYVGENLEINVDYGNGNCDRSVTITIGKNSKDITL